MNKFIFKQIFATKIGWLFICLFFAVLFGVLGNWYDWAFWGIIISMIYPAILTLIMILFAWIINPLRKLFDDDNY